MIGVYINELGESIDDWDYISTIGRKYRMIGIIHQQLGESIDDWEYI